MVKQVSKQASSQLDGLASSERRSLLQQTGLVAASACLGALAGQTPLHAAPDSAPGFSSATIDATLMEIFDTSDAADDASIEIRSPLVTEFSDLVPFEVFAPGAERMAVLFDGNPEPLILSAELDDGAQAFLHARARLKQSGFLHCYAMRGELLGRATRRVTVAGSWFED